MSDEDVGYVVQLEQSVGRLDRQSTEYRVAYEEAQKRIGELTTEYTKLGSVYASLFSKVNSFADYLEQSAAVNSLPIAEFLRRIARGEDVDISEWAK